MNHAATLRVPAMRNQLSKIRAFIYEQASVSDMPPDDIDDLVQAVDEAATNIIVHGYQDGPGDVMIEFENQPGKVIVTLLDHAPSFDPTQFPSPDIHLPLELRPLGGLGIYLMRKCIKEIRYERQENGENKLVLIKDRQQ